MGRSFNPQESIKKTLVVFQKYLKLKGINKISLNVFYYSTLKIKFLMISSIVEFVVPIMISVTCKKCKNI